MRYARRFRFAATALACLLCCWPVTPPAAGETEAEEVGPYPGTVSWPTEFGMRELTTRLQRAAEANGLTIVGTSSATDRDVPGNLVMLVTRNDDAVEVLRADTLAGMELPIRIYIAEQANHHAAIIYRTPSSIFALYDNPKLDALAGRMDQLFAKTVDEAIGGN